MASGWQALGNAIGGGNKLPSALAYEQGQSIGANTADALAQARARVDKNNYMENMDQDPHVQAAFPDPKDRATYIAATLAGQSPESLVSAQSGQFKLGQQKAIADPTTSDAQTARNLLSIGQNANIIHNVGEAGSMTNELHPDLGVQVSPLGAAIGGSTVAKNNAEAAASSSTVPLHASQAHLADVTANNGGKLPNGYAPAIDADGNPVLDLGTGLPKLTFRGGGPADVDAPKPQGAVEARMMNRSLDAATQSAKDLAQIVQLPVGASQGVLGYGATPGKTLLQSVKGDLTNRLAPTEVQQYGVVSSGMSRALASLEAAGGIPSGAFQGSFDKLNILDGDSTETAMLKLAKQRQIIESALSSTITENPRVPAKSKEVANDLLTQLRTAIPFEPMDVIKLHNGDGKMTLAQSMGIKPGAPAAAPGGDVPTFANEAAAQAAGLKPGTKVVIGGQSGTWQ